MFTIHPRRVPGAGLSLTLGLLSVAMVSCGTARPAGNGPSGTSGMKDAIANGDFARGLDGWRTAAPPGGKVTAVRGPDGLCARLSSTDRSGSTYIIQELDPEQVRGRRLRVEARLKAEAIALGTFSYSQAKITLVWNEGQGDRSVEVDFLGTFDWKTVSTSWVVSKDCVKATLYVGMHTTTGTLWVDDVHVAIPQLVSERSLGGDLLERVYDDGTYLCVNDREYSQAKPELPRTHFRPTRAERERGFVVFQTEEPADVVPGRLPQPAEILRGQRGLQLQAARGQYEPISLAVLALRPLAGVNVRPSELVGPAGARLPATAFDLRTGRCLIQRVGYTGTEYHVVPKLLERAREAPLAPAQPRLFWLTLRVPDDAIPGEYSGVVDVGADGDAVSLPLRVRVYPFDLVQGKPWRLFFYDSNPADAELYFRDMREHGMTSVILAQVQAPLRRDGDRAVMDFANSDAFVDAGRKVGFSGPLVYNPFHDRLATRLLEVFGLADGYPKVVNYGERICVFKEGEYPAALQDVYRQIVRTIYDHARTAGWPPLLYFPVDEPNDPNDWRMTAARLEYRLTREAVPDARTFCTAYDLATMARLDPWLDVRACPIGPLVQSAEGNQRFREYLQRAGGEIWGIDWPAMWDDFGRARQLGGFLPAKAGVSGMTAWTYYTPPRWTDDYADLRGQYKCCHIAYRDQDGSLMPTLTWEGLRAGITDWRYIATLEAALAKADGTKRQRAEATLRKVLAEVPWQNESQAGWGGRRAAELRERIATALLALGPGGE